MIWGNRNELMEKIRKVILKIKASMIQKIKLLLFIIMVKIVMMDHQMTVFGKMELGTLAL